MSLKSITILETEGVQNLEFLLLMWLIVGCFISMSYRSVLLASMVSSEFAETIDTIEDTLHSGLPYYVAGNSGGPVLLNGDPLEIALDNLNNNNNIDLINIMHMLCS